MPAQGIHAKPVVAIYSSFLQRGYDRLMHDVAIQDLNSPFANAGIRASLLKRWPELAKPPLQPARTVAG